MDSTYTPFERAVITVFDRVIGDEYYHEIEFHSIEDLRQLDPDDVRLKFAHAIEETAMILGVPDTAQDHGDLGDIVLRHTTELAQYLEETS